MKNIEQQAVKTYQKNISYLSEKSPELFKKLSILDAAIETGQYTERYALEYKEGYFDILDLQNNQFMYGKNSNKISKKIAKKSTAKKDEDVIETFYHAYYNISQKVAQDINDNIALDENVLMSTSNTIHYTMNMAPPSTTTILHIYKYIFFGVGTGKHLELIQRKFKFKQVFIVENSLELFRLSLFTLDYSKVFQDVTIFFSIAEEKQQFINLFSGFFRNGFSHNHFLKYSLFSEEYLNNIKEMQNYIVTVDYLAFPYSKKLVTSIKAPYYLIHNYNYLNLSQPLNKNIFSEKPVIIVAAGPSFGNNIEWLKANKDKFTIVTVFASLKLLHQYNIKPDIVVSLDASHTIVKFFKGIDITTFLKDSIFVFSSMTHKHIVDLVPKENLYLFNSMEEHKQGFGRILAPSVGELSFFLAISLGAKHTYLLGLDLALDPETQHRYADKEHKLNITTENENIYSTQLENTLLDVKGNFIETVKTLPIFKMSINAFNDIAKTRKQKNQIVYNLCNGAHLEGSIPLHIKDIDYNNLVSFNKGREYTENLKSFFQDNSNNTASQNDLDYFNFLTKESQQLLDVLEEYQNSPLYDTIDDNMINFGKLINVLEGKNSNKLIDLHLIMLKYNQFITSYIIAFFNTHEITDHIKHFKYIYKTYLQQSKKIIIAFHNAMKSYETVLKHQVTGNLKEDIEKK